MLATDCRAEFAGRDLAAGQARPEPLPEAGAVGGKLRLEEAAQLALKLRRDVLTAQLLREVHRLFIGVNKGEAAGTIGQVLLQLLADGRLQPILNVLIQELTDITTSKHVGDLY